MVTLLRLEPTKVFMTGSRVYSFPKEDSDIDLVALISGDELRELEALADNHDTLDSPGGEEYEDGRSLRFGRLNLLCITEIQHFKVWKLGTEQLEAKKPVTREYAVEYLANLRHEHGIKGW